MWEWLWSDPFDPGHVAEGEVPGVQAPWADDPQAGVGGGEFGEGCVSVNRYANALKVY